MKPVWCILVVFIIDHSIRSCTAGSTILPITEPSVVNGTDRVIGGVVASLNEFPFMIFLGTLIQWNGIITSTLHCGGSIINENFILTAGQCCSLEVGKYEVIAGTHDIHAWSPLWQRRFVTQKQLHPNYHKIRDIPTHDVCVMRVDRPFIFNQQVQRTSFSQLAILPGTALTTAGWGRTIANLAHSGSPQLLKADLDSMSLWQCQNFYGDQQLDDSMMCAKRWGKISCGGDAGGILLDASRQQVGVVSGGWGCDPDYPGVYAKLQNLLPWILKVSS